MEYGHGGDKYNYEDVVDFSININPLGMSEHVKEAAKRGIEDSIYYPDRYCRKLREQLGEKLALPNDMIVVANGAAELIYSMVLADKPKKALIPIPTFSEYERALKMVNCEIEYYQTKENNCFIIDKSFLNELNEELDIVFLCSPSNPSGRVIDKKLIRQIIERCQYLNIRCVLDECFIEFYEEGTVSLEQMKENSKLFVLRAFTKTYGMPGLRLGYALTSDKNLLYCIHRSCQPWNVSIPAQYAGLAALEEPERVLEMRELVCKERKKIEQKLKDLGIKFISSEVNFILLYSEINLFERLLDFHILIRDCSNYRGLEHGWYRIAIRSEEENERLLYAIEQILSGGGK